MPEVEGWRTNCSVLVYKIIYCRRLKESSNVKTRYTISYKLQGESVKIKLSYCVV